MSHPDQGSPPPDDASPATDLHTLAVHLRRVTLQFQRVTREFAHAHGLHPTDVQALMAILDGDGQGDALTPTRLREHLNLTSGAVSACLNRLEAAGHIRRVRDTADGRVVHLRYAAAGRDLARAYFRPLAQRTDAVRQALTEEERHAAIRFLALLADELTDLRDTPSADG